VFLVVVGGFDIGELNWTYKRYSNFVASSALAQLLFTWSTLWQLSPAQIMSAGVVARAASLLAPAAPTAFEQT
jgi:hypothetical protein